MPIRIYDISVKLGLESKEVLAKAKALGISAAKVPSSSLDKISGEWLEGELIKDHPELAAKLTSLPSVTFSPPPKSQITITATGAELYRLIEKVFNGDVQLRIKIAESESSEPLLVSLIRDSVEKSAEVKPKTDLLTRVEVDEKTKDLLRAAYYASRHNSTDGWVNLAEYGNAVKKLEPTFQPQNFGERSLGSLLRRVTDLFDLKNDETNPIVYYLRLKEEKSAPTIPILTSAPQPHTPIVAKLARGKVHNLRLGYGFIMPDDGSENAFFHSTDVEGCTIFDLKPGDAVEYEAGFNDKGPAAKKVRRLSN